MTTWIVIGVFTACMYAGVAVVVRRQRRREYEAALRWFLAGKGLT